MVSFDDVLFWYFLENGRSITRAKSDNFLDPVRKLHELKNRGVFIKLHISNRKNSEKFSEKFYAVMPKKSF